MAIPYPFERFDLRRALWRIYNTEKRHLLWLSEMDRTAEQCASDPKMTQILQSLDMDDPATWLAENAESRARSQQFVEWYEQLFPEDERIAMADEDAKWQKMISSRPPKREDSKEERLLARIFEKHAVQA